MSTVIINNNNKEFENENRVNENLEMDSQTEIPSNDKFEMDLENEQFLEVLSQRLRYLRERKNWTKTEVQRRLGIPRLSTYSSYEYGTRKPRIDTLLKFAELYDVSVDFILGNDTAETVKDMQLFEAFENENVRRWIIEDLTNADEDQLEKLKSMWKLIEGK